MPDWQPSPQDLAPAKKAWQPSSGDLGRDLWSRALAGGRELAAGFGKAAEQATEAHKGQSLWQRALDPTERGKAMGVALGFGPANIGGATARAAAGVPTPKATEQSMLQAQGVRLTPAQKVPGEALGEVARSAEDRLTSMPILGDFITNMRKHTFADFNLGTINQALAPIKAQLPTSVKAGHDAVTAMHKAISSAYNDIFRQTPKFVIDAQLQRDLKSLLYDSRQYPDVFKNVNAKLGSLFRNPMRTGADIKNIGTELFNAWKGLHNDLSHFNRITAGYFLEARGYLMDALVRQYPQLADPLARANKAFAMSTRIDNAAGRRAGSRGVFTPMDLLTAIKSDARGIRRREFTEGNALMQPWAEAGQRILPMHYPESGTSGRALTNLLALSAAGLGSEYEKSDWPWRAIGGLGLAGIGYRGMGMPGVMRAAGEVGKRAALGEAAREERARVSGQ